MNAIVPTSRPVVFTNDGAVFANSRDVAAFFEKRHDNVLRDIDALIAQQPDLALREFSRATFLKTEEQAENNNLAPTPHAFRCFHMSRDGFTLLAMGFNGAKALAWKLKYLEAFNLMEAELRSSARDPMVVLNDPAAMRGLLLTYSEKVLALEADKAAMQPSVAALDRIATADGSLCVTDAAKVLQVQRKTLIQWLMRNEWVHRRSGNRELVGYHVREVSGDVEHKIRPVQTEDGDKLVSQVRITPLGLTRLAKFMHGGLLAA